MPGFRDLNANDPHIVFDVMDNELLVKDKFLGRVTAKVNDYRVVCCVLRIGPVLISLVQDGDIHDEWVALQPKNPGKKKGGFFKKLKKLAPGQVKVSGDLRFEITLEKVGRFCGC